MGRPILLIERSTERVRNRVPVDEVKKKKVSEVNIWCFCKPGPGYLRMANQKIIFSRYCAQ